MIEMKRGLINFWSKFKTVSVAKDTVTPSLRLVRQSGINEITSVIPAVNSEQAKRTLTWQDFFDANAEMGTTPTRAEFKKFYAKATPNDEPNGAA